jgi:predicted  nucleic acid-binding Zn-ribbon protein
MVTLLNKEQKDDETHKTYCEGEFDTSEDEEKALTQKIASLTSNIDSMKSEIASLSEKIAALTADNADLDKSVADATANRKQENAEFQQHVQLNEAAVGLIFKAKNRLQKFYNPDQHVAAEPAAPTEEELSHSFKVSFLQLKKISIHNANEKVEMGAAPETFEGPYQAKSQKSNSVMALMDKLSNELKAEIQEAQLTEKTATKDYEELLADAQESKSANTQGIVDKSKSKADLETSLEETKNQHIVSSDQLQSVKNYIGDLHQSCDFVLQNFEVRREARTSEVEGLKNAKAVLSGAGYSM